MRAYDPTLGRFISRDPLGRVPLFFSDQPYAYAGNNPLNNVDPSGQRFLAAFNGEMPVARHTLTRATRAVVHRGRLVGTHQAKTQSTGCDNTCMDTIYAELSALGTSMDPLGTLAGVIGLSVGGALGFAGALLVGVEKLKGLWLVGGLAGAFIGGMVISLVANEGVIAYMKAKISDVQQEISHDEAEHKLFDPRVYSDLIGKLHQAANVMIAVDMIGGIVALLGAAALTVAEGPMASLAMWSIAGLGFGAVLGFLLMVRANDDVTRYDRLIRSLVCKNCL